jgi:hypothetical protein
VRAQHTGRPCSCLPGCINASPSVCERMPQGLPENRRREGEPLGGGCSRRRARLVTTQQLVEPRPSPSSSNLLRDRSNLLRDRPPAAAGTRQALVATPRGAQARQRVQADKFVARAPWRQRGGRLCPAERGRARRRLAPAAAASGRLPAPAPHTHPSRTLLSGVLTQ